MTDLRRLNLRPPMGLIPPNLDIRCRWELLTGRMRLEAKERHG